MNFPHPLLIGDVGGTNARIATMDRPGAALGAIVRFRTADHADLADAILAATATLGVAPRSVVVCAAGPLEGRTVVMTNARWTIDGPAIAARLGLEQGLLLNDFEAQALSLPALPAAFLQPIGRPTAPRSGTRLVLGPGTGLGLGGLVENGGRFIALPSEACHADFGPVGEEETALWPWLELVDGRISAESVLSGPGLVRLHRARLAAMGLPRPGIDGGAIVRTAYEQGDSEERRTIALFWRLIARFASDMALNFLARGGVTLAGGVLPRLRSMLDPDEFRAVFEDKAPVADIARAIATSLLVEPDAVLTGLAAIGAAPDRYAVDYDRRAWVGA